MDKFEYQKKLKCFQAYFLIMLYQRWSRIQSAFFWDPQLEPESKGVKKLDPVPESLFIIETSRSLRGLYKYHCLITNISDLPLHGWFPEFEQESDSQI